MKGAGDLSEDSSKPAKLLKHTFHRSVHKSKSKIYRAENDGSESISVANKGQIRQSQTTGFRTSARAGHQKSSHLKSLQRKSGFQEVPKILIEQSNKHIRNKTILSRFMTSTTNRSLKHMIVTGGNKQFKDEQESVSPTALER